MTQPASPTGPSIPYAEKQVALRRRGDVYYCDTPTTLHTHDTESGIRTCLESQGYVRSEGSED